MHRSVTNPTEPGARGGYLGRVIVEVLPQATMTDLLGEPKPRPPPIGRGFSFA